MLAEEGPDPYGSDRTIPDFTHYRLADRTDTEVLVWLDDHSRYALSVTVHDRVTGDIVVDTFNRCGSDLIS